MSPLGDFFPEGHKKKFSEDKIKVGAVIKTFSNHTNPPKEKRQIITGIKGNTVGVIFINSENNAPTKLQPFQKAISKKGNEKFLDKDSHIDCSKIYEEELEDLRAKVSENANVHMGDISTGDLVSIIGLVKASPNIDAKSLDKFGLV